MRKFPTALALVMMAGCGPADRAPVPVERDQPAAAPQTSQSVEVSPEAPPGSSAPSVNACLVQDGAEIAANSIRAVGTEPFWAANVVGRCVTYSTPEDQDGTRVWTRFEGSASSGRWTGALDKQEFVMSTRPEAGCSDGMSDTVYPIAVTLTVRGEERRGCAEPR